MKEKNEVIESSSKGKIKMFFQKITSWDDESKLIIFSDDKKNNFYGPYGFKYYWNGFWKEQKNTSIDKCVEAP